MGREVDCRAVTREGGAGISDRGPRWGVNLWVCFLPVCRITGCCSIGCGGAKCITRTSRCNPRHTRFTAFYLHSLYQRSAGSQEHDNCRLSNPPLHNHIMSKPHNPVTTARLIRLPFVLRAFIAIVFLFATPCIIPAITPQRLFRAPIVVVG